MKIRLLAALLLLPAILRAEETVLTAKYATETATFTATATATYTAEAAFTATATLAGTEPATVKTAEEEATATATSTPVVLLPENINVDNTDMYSVKLSWVPAGDPANIWYDILRRAANETA